MKIYCSRTELNKALNNVSHSVPVRTTSNILEGILINVEEGKMKLTATDTNMTTETVINVNCEGICEFVVPAKLFSAIISKLPEDDMMIDYDNEKSKINIKSGGSNSEIICFRGDEYPKIFLDEGENVIYLDKEDVKKLIKKTAFSASTDEFNRIITGVLLEIKDGSMKMVGVDPYRIAAYKIPVENRENISVIIPAKLIIEVSKFIDDDGDSKMSFEVIDNKVVMKFDNNKVIINLCVIGMKPIFQNNAQGFDRGADTTRFFPYLAGNGCFGRFVSLNTAAWQGIQIEFLGVHDREQAVLPFQDRTSGQAGECRGKPACPEHIFVGQLCQNRPCGGFGKPVR